MRKVVDFLLSSVTNIFSFFGISILIAIIIFIFSNGASNLSMDFIMGDYEQKLYTVSCNVNQEEFQDPMIDDTYFSKKWGISFQDGENKVGEEVVYIVYVDQLSPLRRSIDVTSKEVVEITTGQMISQALMVDDEENIIIALSSNGAEDMALQFDRSTYIQEMKTMEDGGGIRGSLITTLYLVGLTLIIALPIGIISAIYLCEFAQNNKVTEIIRTMIDMTTGIPSIVFGLLGMLIFIPFMDKVIGSNGGSIASGSLTLAVILLPTIIKTTEESIKIIPNSLRHASLALGSSKTQMIFKVILPNAIPGILAACLLAIGRIIGESAALIYAIGTSISDDIKINEMSTSLAVHMWSIMSGDVPNIEAACTIAIIILFLTLMLTLITKLISKKWNKFEVK